ncbi:MAG: 3-dehydroquinate synthase, partial [Acidobacteriota bacterium]|nr:3-dehydroquinate synthase [Acidobacteriota bacterium]
MDGIRLKIGSPNYEFWLGTNCQDELDGHLISIGADIYFIIADEEIADLYGRGLCARLNLSAPSFLIQHVKGEEAKRLATIDQIIESILSLGATRRSCVAALGGGVTGNIAGLVAALLFRGIRLVHIPTTLVAILDSVVSFKQAVNASCGKNIIGTYYRPEMVLADIAYLRSLPVSHVRSGMCEVIKNALAICPDQIPFLLEILNPDAFYSDSVYSELIRRNIELKSLIMENDQYEKYGGVVLEYGHTVGHVLELLSEGCLPHGEAIGLGMLTAAEIGLRLGGLSPYEAEIHHR